MPSVHEIKCPSCGAENAPCLVQNGQYMYHIERKKAAYPTTYEHPDCEECRQLKDRMVNAEHSVTAFGPSSCGGTPKSKWGKAYKDHEARAKYEVHLGVVHNDERYQRELGQNLSILLREGRLRP
jgi:hypothetical protein